MSVTWTMWESEVGESWSKVNRQKSETFSEKYLKQKWLGV
jgi:hypothetical protein